MTNERVGMRLPGLILTILIATAGAVVPTAAQGLADYDYEYLEFRGVGFEAGRIWPRRVDPATHVGIRIDLGMIGPRVRIVPTARFWSSALDEAEVDRLAEQIILVCERQGDVSCPDELDLGEVRLSDLELSTDAHVLLFPDRAVTPYAGLNLGLHLLNGRGDFIDGTFVEDLLDSVAPGLGSVLGVSARLTSYLELGAEARFMLASDVRYASIGANAVWIFPGGGQRPADVVAPAP